MQTLSLVLYSVSFLSQPYMRSNIDTHPPWIFISARGETRTHTSLRTADFESAGSTIPPLGHIKKNTTDFRSHCCRRLGGPLSFIPPFNGTGYISLTESVPFLHTPNTRYFYVKRMSTPSCCSYLSMNFLYKYNKKSLIIQIFLLYFCSPTGI